MKAGLWLRVSDPDKQDAENQRPALEALAHRRGDEVVKVYLVGASAWRGEHEKALSALYQDARRGVFRVLYVWALDRLHRGGVAALLEAVHRLGRSGVQVISLQEPWTEAEGELRDLLLSIAGWVGNMESRRRSERTKLGLQRALALGKTLGRPKGSLDRRVRKKSGYYSRWSRQRETGHQQVGE